MKGLDTAAILAAGNQILINVTALVVAITACIVALHNRSQVKLTAKVSEDNTNRLDSLENGGGDRKIDDRLAKHQLIDRRISTEVTK